MQRLLDLDEVLDITPEISEVKFITSNRNLSIPDGIVELFSLVMAKLISRSRLPLDMKYNWGVEDSDAFGTFSIYLYETIVTQILFWRRYKHNDVVSAHYDCNKRKLIISFNCPDDYHNTVDLIKKFIAEHTELEISVLIIFIWEKTSNGSNATKLEKVLFR